MTLTRQLKRRSLSNLTLFPPAPRWRETPSLFSFYPFPLSVHQLPTTLFYTFSCAFIRHFFAHFSSLRGITQKLCHCRLLQEIITRFLGNQIVSASVKNVPVYTRSMEMTNQVKERGMTLIEILLVIALIAMCSLWGLQGWRAYQQSLVLEQHAQKLRSYLTELQAEANAYNRSIVLWVINGAGGCVGQGSRPERCGLEGVLPHFHVADADVEIIDFTNKVMGFYGIRNAAQAGHITLRNSAGSLRIILSARGRLRICSEGKPMLGVPVCG